MTLSKKNYIKIASIINQNAQHISVISVMHDLIDYFIEDNPNFDVKKFKVACGVE